MATDVRALLVTAPDGEVADSLARAVVGEGLAACVNVVPGVVSIFRWQGEVMRDTEVLMVIKTTDGNVEPLRARVVELHPYEVPEVLVLTVDAGHEPYLDWVRGEAVPRS